jgi:lipid II:glycine glycyltransferase (peptidoglycan interpeptide bridge formation enzyme)
MTKKAGRPKIQHSEPIETKCMRIPRSKVKAFYRLAKSARKKVEVKTKNK